MQIAIIGGLFIFEAIWFWGVQSPIYRAFVQEVTVSSQAVPRFVDLGQASVPTIRVEPYNGDLRIIWTSTGRTLTEKPFLLRYWLRVPCDTTIAVHRERKPTRL